MRHLQWSVAFAYSPLFPFYLIERVAGGNNGIIRTTWEEYQRSGNCRAMKPVLQRVLGVQNPPTTIERIFPDYTEANYFLAYANEAEIPNYDNYRWVTMALTHAHTSSPSPLTYRYTGRVTQPTPTATFTLIPTRTPVPTQTRTPTP